MSGKYQLTSRRIAPSQGSRGTLSEEVSKEFYGSVENDVKKVTKGCHPYFVKAFNYLIALLIVFIVYDVTTQYNRTEAVFAGKAAEAVAGLARNTVDATGKAAIDVAGAVVASGVVKFCTLPNVIGPNSPQNLKKLLTVMTVQPALTTVDRRLYELGMKYRDVVVLDTLIKETRKKLIEQGGLTPVMGPVDSAGHLPIANPPRVEQLLLDSKPVAKVEASLISGFVRNMKDWVGSLGSLTMAQDIRNSVNPCRSYDMELKKVQKNTEIRLRLAMDAFEAELSMLGAEVSTMTENVKLALWRVIILSAVLKTVVLLRKLISPSRSSEAFPELLNSEIDGQPEFQRLNFRMKKSRKRRSAKRKASRKVSRKRRSVKRKVSRKRRSVKRKVSRKRRSVKRKVSRKRRSTKRKASRKRRSTKRKASRKRRSTKRKASRKRKSAKRKASRKRKSAKRKASRKRKSAKRKASRKRKSAKRKASRKRKRCPPGCVKRR
jgi:hypothetical protein